MKRYLCIKYDSLCAQGISMKACNQRVKEDCAIVAHFAQHESILNILSPNGAALSMNKSLKTLGRRVKTLRIE